MISLKKFMEIKECVNIIVVTAKEDFKQVSAEINSLVDKRIIVTLGGQTSSGECYARF